MQRVLFLGRKPVAATALEWLCEQPDVEIAGVVTDRHMPVSVTADAAEKRGLKLMTREEAEHAAASGTLAVDLAVSVLYWQKIRTPILEAARLGAINFHPAPLPDFKGTGGYNLAILHGLSEWGVSAHYVDETIDTGPIIQVDRVRVDPRNDTAQSLETRCREPLVALFKNVVARALAAEGRLDSYDNRGGRYLSRAEMEAMKQIVDGDDVERKVRAFWYPPYDGAYVIIAGRRYTLVGRSILDSLADPSNGRLFLPGAVPDDPQANG